MLPTLFISHGAPNLILQDIPARKFLADYSASLPRPEALLVVSAHYESDTPAVTASEHPPTIHDFRGFEPEMYEMRYPAPGAPALAKRVADMIEAHGLPARLEERGLDHGAWVPLKLLYPDAGIPVVEMSVQTLLGAAHHLELGRALAGLRKDDILIMGSGSFTHNLSELDRSGAESDQPGWVVRFSDWMHEHVAAGAWDELADYRRRAPEAERNHPTEEHLLPLFVAIGAAGDAARAEQIHRSHMLGSLRMDAYAFN